MSRFSVRDVIANGARKTHAKAIFLRLLLHEKHLKTLRREILEVIASAFCCHLATIYCIR